MEEMQSTAGGGGDLLMECDEEEQEVCPQSLERGEDKKGGGHDEAVSLMEEVRIIPIPVQPVSSCSPPTLNHTHSHTLNHTLSHTLNNNNVKGPGAPLGFKVNGLLVSLLPGGGGAELKLRSYPRGSASGFTTIQIPVSLRADSPADTEHINTSSSSAPPPSAPGPDSTPIITGVVSGEAAQRVLSNHSVSFKNRKAPPSTSPLTTPTSSRTPAAPHRLLKKGQLGPVSPPDCLICRSHYKLITELRGFMCLCSPAIAQSLKKLKKKKKKMKKKRRRRSRDKKKMSRSSTLFQKGVSASKVVSPIQRTHRLSDDSLSDPFPSPAPLPTSCSLQQDQSEPPQDPPQGKLVILVEDFYYGSAPGRRSRANLLDSGINGPYHCMHCQSTLHNNITLMRHMQKHVTSTSQQDRRRDSVSSCPHCFRHFPSPFRLQCHLEAVHSQYESTAKCKICELAFGSEAAFLWHMKSTHKPGEMPYTCQVCDFRSSFYSDIRSHFEHAHADTKHLLCPFCLRVMSSNTCYQQHVARHQRKHVFGCDQCRLHFLYVKERIQHKLMHHRTHVKPAQLTGLKAGTKVTVRTFSVVGRCEEELKKAAPCKVVDVDPPPPKQEAPKMKLVESLGALLSTLSQESVAAGVSRPAPLCVECLSSVQDFRTHFPSVVRCSLCSFITCCCTAYANHMINNHTVHRKTPQYTSIYVSQPRLSERLTCASCSFSTYRGDVMANHLTERAEHHCIMLSHNELSPPDAAPPANQTSDELFAPLDDEFESDDLCEAPETGPGQQNTDPEVEGPGDLTCDKVRADMMETEHAMYGDITYSEQEAFSSTVVSQQQIQSVDCSSSTLFFYRLTDILGQSQEVCNTLLLTTLGFHPIPDIRSSPPASPVIQEAASNVKLDQIYQHIESFHPTVSHYRRDHAHHQRFLPSDVCVRLMYDEFAAKPKVSFKRFKRAVNTCGISFSRPGEEPCELCLQHELHVRDRHQDQEPPPDCSTCRRWEDHRDRAERGARHYKQDANKQQSDELSVRRVDLQRVVMLPRMPGVKPALFTKRISAFHETFVAVGRQKKSISVIWHEGVALRKAVEVASAYVCVLQREKNVPHIVLWLDGCTAQNRNWCLLTTLATVVNQDSTCTEDITLKYFEPGHTSTRSTCFHHRVEREMQKQPEGTVLDFQDFRRVIESSDFGKVDVVELQNEDIRAWKEGHSRRKLENSPPLPELAQIQFRRGSRYMWVKLSHDQGEFTPVDFLRNKSSLSVPEPLRPAGRGVGRQKKSDILRNLCPLMPPNRRLFWESLTECAEDEE